MKRYAWLTCLLACLLPSVARGAEPSGYQLIKPTVGEPFHLIDGFATLEPTLAGTDGKSLPLWGGTAHIILLNDGRLLAAYASANQCRTITSSDVGATWTKPVVVDAPFPPEFKDAKVHRPAIVQTREGHLCLFFYGLIKYDVPNPDQSINPLWATKSTDEGKTWSKPKLIHDGYVGMLQGAIVTSKGNIVVPICRYAAVRRYAGLCVVSTDGGETWKPSNLLDVADPEQSKSYPHPLSPNSSRGAIEPSVAELPDGRLLMMIRTVSDAMFQSYSTDGGLTWSPPARSPISCGGPGNVVRLPSGKLVIAYNPANYESAMGKRWGSPIGYDRQSIAILNDDAATWTVTHDFVKQVEGASRVVHSTVTGLPDGTVLITLPGRSALLRTSEKALMTPRPAAATSAPTTR